MVRNIAPEGQVLLMGQENRPGCPNRVRCCQRAEDTGPAVRVASAWALLQRCRLHRMCPGHSDATAGVGWSAAALPSQQGGLPASEEEARMTEQVILLVPAGVAMHPLIRQLQKRLPEGSQTHWRCGLTT